MPHPVKLFLGALALTAGSVQGLYAQDTAPVFAVAYIEVMPSATERAIGLLRDYARASAAEAGNLRFQILQRTGRPNHFAILEAWADQQARDAHASSAGTRALRSNLEPLLYSPYDERPSTPVMDTSGTGGEGELYILTHVDLVRTGLEEGLAHLEAFVAQSRRQPGAVDIGVIIQDSRTNHMTLFEVWSSAATQATNAASDHSKRYRSEILSRSGSLYDERLYRRL